VSEIATLLDALVSRRCTSVPIASIGEWWQVHLDCAPANLEPAHRAVLGGFACDRLGYAFASGYTEAMRRVGNPDAPLSVRRRALCATETGGGHPRAISCALTPGADGRYVLRGAKTFVTLGVHAEELIIIASRGHDARGRNRLVAARVPAARAGVELSVLAPTPFAPEIPHGRVDLHEVAVDPRELLPGDGYLNVLKPFRTVEDCHVFLATLGWLIRIGREAGWSPALIERGLASVAALASLARSRAPLSPGIHRALGGAIDHARDYLDLLERGGAWAMVEPALRNQWKRDKALLSVASKVRQRRLEAARAADS